MSRQAFVFTNRDNFQDCRIDKATGGLRCGEADPSSRYPDLELRASFSGGGKHFALFHVEQLKQGTFGEGLGEAWSQQDLLCLRKPDRPLTNGVMRTTLAQISGLARDMFDLDSDVQLPSSIRELPHAFTFRVALCGYLGFQSRFADGSTKALSASKARNDLVDAMQCASAL